MLNEAADARARAAAEAFQRGSAVPTGPGFGAASDSPVRVTVPAVEAEPEPAPDELATLFDFDEPQSYELTLQLDASQYERLVGRARAAGVSPDELLRSLI